MSCSCGKLINQPKGVNPEARIVLEGVTADHYNGGAQWTFSNLDKIFGQTAWADCRFVNLRCANFVVPDPIISGPDVCFFQMWRVRLATSSQAYNQSRCGASNKEFTPNLNYPALTDGGTAQTNPSRTNGEASDVLFYMIGDNIRQSTLAFAGSEATAGELKGNVLCVAKENLSQIKVIIEMYQPAQTTTVPALGAGSGGKWVDLHWADSAFGFTEKYSTAQFAMVLMAKPVSQENRA